MKRLFVLIVCFLSLNNFKAFSSATFAAQFPAAQNSPSNLKFVPDSVKRDTIVLPEINPTVLALQNNIYKRRLDSIKKDVALDYNEYVQSYIDIYLHNREDMAHVLGLTKYYFPIYEKAFKDAGIPDEIKYLSIVESKLDPYAVSRVGATGPWQFMFTTAKLYGLNIDGFVDDRRDPIQASYAAARYLKDAFNDFGDWLLAIASYNCGKSNVDRAIQKSGGAKDFWSIRQYLPAETRNYVPAFIAINYVMNYYSRHNIIPKACNFSLQTDTVLVNKYISLGTISHALGMDTKDLAMLNPAYKRQIINGSATVPRRLIVPQVEGEKFAALYDVLNSTEADATAAQVTFADDNEKMERHPERLSFHKVKHGETLREIADNYGLEVQDLKVWNHLHNNKAKPGQELKLSVPANETAYKPSAKHHKDYITYKVKTGDTLSGIASRFEGASVERLRSMNGLKKDRLQPGMTIRINKG